MADSDNGAVLAGFRHRLARLKTWIRWRFRVGSEPDTPEERLILAVGGVAIITAGGAFAVTQSHIEAFAFGILGGAIGWLAINIYERRGPDNLDPRKLEDQ